ncbi:ImmA/IrrE family metallo-endopeptidase [Corynebacterium hylobatis]|uniref:ImmA/IrrE family metallo-endopeptidase n=1 Tax=Corynebacterium hylobatis TaxID=1859290 RepID=A0A430HVJ1_9CORY|nr:ImmA/IrrE family metallo-endopeptidase [Corynebacterium hylobatis]RSZ61511.1 ImmA/IrrE family metallo-endopeptidase [Corynebacterium hylobatis]
MDSLLEARLASLGVHLVESGRLNDSLNAAYHHDTRTIVVRWGLDPVTRRCAIAHELGHAHWGHDCSTPRYERDADEYAAELLLTLDIVEQASLDLDHAAPAVAAELGVTPYLLEVWMKLYETGRIKPNYDCILE